MKENKKNVKKYIVEVFLVNLHNNLRETLENIS